MAMKRNGGGFHSVLIWEKIFLLGFFTVMKRVKIPTINVFQESMLPIGGSINEYY